MPTAPRGWLSLGDLFLSQDPSWFSFSMDTSVRQGALFCPTYTFFWLPSAGFHRAIHAEESGNTGSDHTAHCLLHCSRCTDQCLHHTHHSTGGVWLESEYLAAGKRHRWLKQVYNPPTYSGTHCCVVMLTRRWACGSGQVLKYETLVNWGCHKEWIDTEFQWKSVIFTGQGPPEIINSSHVVPPWSTAGFEKASYTFAKMPSSVICHHTAGFCTLVCYEALLGLYHDCVKRRQGLGGSACLLGYVLIGHHICELTYSNKINAYNDIF